MPGGVRGRRRKLPPTRLETQTHGIFLPRSGYGIVEKEQRTDPLPRSGYGYTKNALPLLPNSLIL